MQFRDFLHALNLMPPPVIVPGRWMRCGTACKPRSKNGSFKLAADERVGWAINFSEMIEAETWWRDKEEKPLPVPCPIINAARWKAEQERRAAAIVAARQHYIDCEPLLGEPLHPYFAKKRITMRGLRGLKKDSEGRIVVPMILNGNIVSCQTIDSEGEKRFFASAPTKGTSVVIDRPHATLSVFTEGLATGATLAEAIPDARVFIAFSAINLVEVAETMKVKGWRVVAADNDHETEQRIGKNPGVVAGTKAATALKCGAAWPQEIRGTDWNDFFVEDLERRDAERQASHSFPQPDNALRNAALAAVARCVMVGARFV